MLSLPEDRKNVPMPSTLAGPLWVHRHMGWECGALRSGILPVGLAGHVCNLFLFLDTCANAV